MQNYGEGIKIDSICELMKKCEKDDGTFSESLYILYFFIGLTKGIEDAKSNRGTPLEEFKKERETLYEHNNRRYG